MKFVFKRKRMQAHVYLVCLLFLLVLLPSHTWSQTSCSRFFTPLTSSEQVLQSLNESVRSYQSLFTAIDTLRLQNESHILDYNAYIRQVNQILGLAKSLTSKLPHTFEDFAYSLTAIEFEVVPTPQLFFEAVLVERALSFSERMEKGRASKAANKNSLYADVHFIKKGAFDLNNYYQSYLKISYQRIDYYLHLKNLPPHAKSERVKYLLKSDKRFLKLGEAQKEQFLQELIYFVNQGQDSKLTADRYFLRN